ncbi:MAG: response regulator [Desulfobacteraceae bacterium]|nr:response regulator [Desulfobacteraceae bacterium]
MPTILAIDDKQDNLLSLSALLKSTIPGCRIVTALSGGQGIKKAKTQNPDIILLDVHMPEMNGFETCRILKSDHGTKHIPVIMLTAVKTDPESRIKGLEIGSDAFLSKPIDQFELTAQIKAMLRIKYAEDSLRNKNIFFEKLVTERTSEIVKKHQQLILEIEERRQAEELTKEQANLLDLIFEHSLDRIVILDKDYNFIRVSKTYAKACQKDLSEFAGHNHFEFYPSILKDEFDEAKKAKRIYQKSTRPFLFPDHPEWGTSYWDLGLVPILDKEDEIKFFLFTLKDVTRDKCAKDQMNWEIELNQARIDISKELISQDYDIEKVSTQALKFSKHLTASNHGFISSIDMNTLENIKLRSIKTLREQSSIKNQKITFPGGNDEIHSALWEHVLNTKKAFFSNSPGKHPQFKEIPEGHIPLKNYMAVPIMMGESLLGVIELADSDRNYTRKDIMAIQQISEIFTLALHRQAYKIEKQSLEKNLRQLQKNEAIGALAGGIAHDFNNILFPIVGFAELLKEDLSKDSPLQENIHEILTGAKRAKNLVKQILTFTRQTEQELKPLRPHLIIKEVIKLIKATIPTSIQIKQNIDPQSKTIMADPTQIHQIAMNLITNAYHSMLDSGGVLSITLKNINYDDSLKHLKIGTGPHIFLSIEDTGIGMDQDILEKIFDPYFTTKPKDKGTGLGLSVVYGIVRNYGGDIEVKSQEGLGSKFIIYLPAFESEVVAEKKPEILADQGGNEKILLVDDELPVLRLEQKILQRLGYKIDATNSSEEALKKIQFFPDKYDLVISDMAMPNMPGDVLAREIRKITFDLPIIICTGFSENLTPEKAAEIGINEILIKPIIKTKLLKTIRKILD